jgi:hypothetical protein
VELISRGGWVLLEALISHNSDENVTKMDLSNKNIEKNNSLFFYGNSGCFVIDCFFQKQEKKQTVGHLQRQNSGMKTKDVKCFLSNLLNVYVR